MSRGFTLVELVVAVGIFAIVMLMSVSSLLSLLDIDRKVQGLKSVINNLNFALDSMTRELRVGSAYHCGTLPLGSIGSVRNCPSGGNYIAFERFGGDRTTTGDQVVYKLESRQLWRSTNGGFSFVVLTAPEVVIRNGDLVPSVLPFFVTGTTAGDDFQPKMLVTLKGEAGRSEKTKTTFSIETTVSQRLYDI